jgi:hypothetical protein
MCWGFNVLKYSTAPIAPIFEITSQHKKRGNKIISSLYLNDM